MKVPMFAVPEANTDIGGIKEVVGSITYTMF